MDKRIGMMNAEKITWPEQTISGLAYDRKHGVSTVTLGMGYFAVLNSYPVPNQNAIILELSDLAKSYVTPKGSVAKGAPKDSSNE